MVGVEGGVHRVVYRVVYCTPVYTTRVHTTRARHRSGTEKPTTPLRRRRTGHRARERGMMTAAMRHDVDGDGDGGDDVDVDGDGGVGGCA